MRKTFVALAVIAAVRRVVGVAVPRPLRSRARRAVGRRHADRAARGFFSARPLAQRTDRGDLCAPFRLAGRSRQSGCRPCLGGRRSADRADADPRRGCGAVAERLADATSSASRRRSSRRRTGMRSAMSGRSTRMPNTASASSASGFRSTRRARGSSACSSGCAAGAGSSPASTCRRNCWSGSRAN